MWLGRKTMLVGPGENIIVRAAIECVVAANEGRRPSVAAR